MIGFGNVSQPAPSLPQPLNSPVFSGAATSDGGGYVLASVDGGVFASGTPPSKARPAASRCNGPIVALALTPDAKGYWLGAIDGGVFAYGDAPFYGSMGVVAPEPAHRRHGDHPRRQGLLARGGGRRHLRLRRRRLLREHRRPGAERAHRRHGIHPDGKGYWLVAADGGIFNYGDAGFYGSAGNQNLPDWVVGMVASPDGGGYLMATANGVVLPYGDAKAYGGLSLDPTATQISAIIGNNQGTGYWLLDPQAWQYSFSTATPEPEFTQSNAIAEIAASQIEPDPDVSAGVWCNPYGPCEEWCALFATWVWERAGIPIPNYAFTGDIWSWAVRGGAVLPPTAAPAVGDAVLYGTGPGASPVRCTSGWSPRSGPTAPS